MLDLHACKTEECEKEGNNFSSFHELIAEMAIDICSWYHFVRLFAAKMTVTFACGGGVILAHYIMQKVYFTPEHTILHMHFSCRQHHRIKVSSPYLLQKVRNEALLFYFTNK